MHTHIERDLFSVIDAIQQAGVIDIRLDGDDLDIIARCALPDQVIDLIRHRKPELIALLRAGEAFPFAQAIAAGPGAAGSVITGSRAAGPGVAATPGDFQKKSYSQNTQNTQKSETPHQDAENGVSGAVRKNTQKYAKKNAALPACPHPWHELFYLQRALAGALPGAVEARIEIYPAPLRLRLTRRDTGDALDIPHRDLARIASPDDPALATNAAAVIDEMLDVWADLAEARNGHR